MATLCLGVLIDKPSHAGRSCRILRRPEQLHLNAFSAAHFVQMLPFANTRTGQGPSRELSAADLLLVASTEAEAIDAMTVTENYLRCERCEYGTECFLPVINRLWILGVPCHTFPPFLLRTSTCLYFRQTDLLVPNPSI